MTLPIGSATMTRRALLACSAIRARSILRRYSAQELRLNPQLAQETTLASLSACGIETPGEPQSSQWNQSCFNAIPSVANVDATAIRVPCRHQGPSQMTMG